MKKLFTIASGVAVSLSALLSVASPALADDNYVNDAVTGLHTSSVYIDSDTNLTDSGKISSEFKDTPVGVAVLPPTATTTYSPNDVADMIRSGTDESTVVLVIDNASGSDRIVVSSKKNQDEITKVLNEALTKNNGDAGTAISTTVQDVKQLASGNTNTGGADVGPIIFPVAIAVASLVAVGSFLFFRIFPTSRGTKKKTLPSGVQETTAPNRFSDLLPEKLNPLMRQLSDLIKQHNTLSKDSLSPDLKTIIDHIQELFNRLSKTGTNSQKQLAEVEYADKLPKLIDALGSNYYVDIVNHEDLWDDSEERLEAVKVAVKAVDKQLIANIRQVNASKDLEFQVALDSLVGSVNAPTMNDIYKNSERKNK